MLWMLMYISFILYLPVLMTSYAEHCWSCSHVRRILVTLSSALANTCDETEGQIPLHFYELGPSRTRCIESA